MFATFDFIPVNVIEFSIKFFNRSTINIPFIYIYVTSFLFPFIIGDKNTNPKMMTNITFKNYSFKIGINKTIFDDVVYCCCWFF